jgi:hypothetical protein
MSESGRPAPRRQASEAAIAAYFSRGTCGQCGELRTSGRQRRERARAAEASIFDCAQHYKRKSQDDHHTKLQKRTHGFGQITPRAFGVRFDLSLTKHWVLLY